MLVIVEGIDRVGKTTLCNKLNNELNFPIYKHCGDFKYSRMDNDNETDKMVQLLEICRLSNADVIFDRFHFTDFVYGTIERKYDKEKAIENLKCIESLMEKLNCFIIYIIPTDINESSKQHGKDLSKHLEEFNSCFYKSKIKKTVCNYNTMDEAIKKLRGYINERYN